MLTSTKELGFLFGISLVWQSSRALLASPPLLLLSRQYASSSFLLAGKYALYNDDNNNNSDEPYAVCEERTMDESTTGLSTEELKDEVANWYPTMWKEFEFTSANNGQSFWARETSFGCGRLGSEIWTAAVALGLYLVKESSKVTGKQILELGAGVGLPSLVCQYELGASNVVATDFWDPEEFFSTGGDAPGRSFGENLYFNLCQGKIIKPFDQQTMAQRLDWTDLDTVKAALTSFEGGTPDLVVGSDLVYYPEIVEPLISVLKTLMESCSEAILVIALDSKREARDEFLQRLPEELLNCQVESKVYRVEHTYPSQNKENEDFLFLTIAKN